MADMDLPEDIDTEDSAGGVAIHDKGEPETPENWQPPPGAVLLDGKKKEEKPAKQPSTHTIAKPTRKWGAPGRFKTLVFAVTLVLGTFLGVAWLNAKGDSKSRQGHIFMGAEQGRSALQTLLRGIESANSEIMVAAAQINNRPILDALINRHEEGVDILVLLDPKDPKATQVQAYLTNNGFPATRALIHQRPLNTQLVLIDRTFVITGSLPFNQNAVAQTSDMVLINNPQLARAYRDQLRQILIPQ